MGFDKYPGSEKPGDGRETEFVEDEHDPDGDRKNNQEISQNFDIGHSALSACGDYTLSPCSSEIPRATFGAMPLRAIIFDFNGVIADDETPHLLMFQQALREEGLSLTKEEYYETYLGMDERNCLAALIQSARGKRDPACEQRVQDRKVALFRAYTATHKPELFPGVADFVLQAGDRYRLAVASGGKREQIADALRNTPIERVFPVIVSAEDTTIGKPDPAIYRLTLARLNDTDPKPQPPLQPADCLVIEDSLAGIQSAKAAGMKVVGVATTYPAAVLKEADVVFPSLGAISFAQLEQLFRD